MSAERLTEVTLALLTADRVHVSFTASLSDTASYPSLYLSRAQWDDLGNPPNVVVTVAPR
jgi:hypothetical protein